MEAAFPYRDALNELQPPPHRVCHDCGLFASRDTALTRMRHLIGSPVRAGLQAHEKRHELLYGYQGEGTPQHVVGHR